MSMRISFFATVGIVLLLAACGPKGGDPNIIRWADLKETPLPEAGLSCFSAVERIQLDPEPNEYAVAYPLKVIVSGDKIFLMGGNGPNSSYVVQYGHDGMPVCPIGKRGRGPGEYPRVTDFSVDDAGDCWLLDAGTMTMYHYGAEGGFVGSLRQKGLEKSDPDMTEVVLFENVANLPSGELLLGTALWDESSWKDFRTVICDTLLNVRKGQVADPHTLDLNFTFECHGFCKTGSGFQYLVPLEDKVHIFDRQGEYLRSVSFDFGAKAVSADFRKDVEPHMDELANHTFLSGAAYVDDDWAMGTLQSDSREGLVTFVADRRTGRWYDVTASLGFFYGVWDGRSVWLKDADDGWLLILCTMK